jgi:hypothetical protein
MRPLGSATNKAGPKLGPPKPLLLLDEVPAVNGIVTLDARTGTTTPFTSFHTNDSTFPPPPPLPPPLPLPPLLLLLVEPASTATGGGVEPSTKPLLEALPPLLCADRVVPSGAPPPGPASVHAKASSTEHDAAVNATT